MFKDGGSVHYMQLPVWATVKNKYGWKSRRVSLSSIDDQAEIYRRLVPGVGSLVYIPGLQGITQQNAAVFTDEIKKLYNQKGFGVRLELNQELGEDLLESLLKSGWKKSAKHTQYRYTVKLDLSQSEDVIWMNMKSRGRYEILQAQKLGVITEEVEPTDENLKKMYDLLKLTSARNKFYIRDAEFMMLYWQKFRESGQLKLFFALHDGELLSGAVVLVNGTKAWYKDGGSTRTKSNMMAPRLLQWEAIKSLKSAGVTFYDLGGIPDPKSHQTSSMHGIYVFKTAYSKETTELMPTLEFALNSRYALWPKAEKQWLRVYNLFAHNLWW